MANRTNEKGREIIGEKPDCICDGEVITLHDCPCSECRELYLDMHGGE